MEVLRTAHAPSWRASTSACSTCLFATACSTCLVDFCLVLNPACLPMHTHTRTHRVQVFAGAAVLRGRVGARAHHGAPDFDRR